MDNLLLLSALEGVLGKGYKRSKDNYAFHCPFCHHRKPKLEIHITTNEKGENPFACWVCETRGKTIYSLLKQMKVPPTEAREVLKHVKKNHYYQEEPHYTLSLPAEFEPLYKASDTSVIANKIKQYLYIRGLTDNDFIKYNIGYCLSGDYEGRIIIPSYDENNHLNFFVARSYGDSYFKYKNPEMVKDELIFFDNLINWNKPIILCEGVFDAIAIRRNAIPILGKNISKALMKKIITSKVSDIYIALDPDALKKALIYCEQFLNLGKKVYLIRTKEKDPSEAGFKSFTNQIQTAQELDFHTLMQYKLSLV